MPVKFYDFAGDKLVLTDDVFHLFSMKDSTELENEVLSRWDLLEAAFVIKRGNVDLVNDIRRIYLESGYDRKDITNTIPVLNGYQKGICFYCSEEMKPEHIHVDHVIPRQLIYHDEIWNLVLAHSFCNEQKSDLLPGVCYIDKLIQRNEYLIASNHPLKSKLIKQLGKDSHLRGQYVTKVYDDAKIVIGNTWKGVRGYNLSSDPFYKSFVRVFINR